MTKNTKEREVFFRLFKQSSRIWQEEAKKTLPMLAEAAVFMASNGWWMLPQLSPFQYQGILANRMSLQGESLTDSIVAWANKPGEHRLQEIVSSWSLRAFTMRHHIFEEALWAHEHEKYHVTLPVLLAQIEGIVRMSLAVATGGAPQSFDFKKVRNGFAAKLKTLGKLTKKQKISIGHIRAAENFHNLAVVEKIFESFNSATDPVPSALNRHAVAHGIAIDYGTRENSTKALLFLDMLHALCAQVEENV